MASILARPTGLPQPVATAQGHQALLLELHRQHVRRRFAAHRAEERQIVPCRLARPRDQHGSALRGGHVTVRGRPLKPDFSCYRNQLTIDRDDGLLLPLSPN